MTNIKTAKLIIEYEYSFDMEEFVDGETAEQIVAGDEKFLIKNTESIAAFIDTLKATVIDVKVTLNK